MRNEESVRKVDITKPSVKAEVQMRFLDKEDSVCYFRSIRDDDVDVETLDVYRSGEAGFIVTFYDEVPVDFSRAGGRNTQRPRFSSEQLEVLLALLRRIRTYASKA